MLIAIGQCKEGDGHRPIYLSRTAFEVLTLGMSVTKLQRVLRVCNFGPVPVKYAEALSLQERLAELCKHKQAPDTLLQLQVCTLFRHRQCMLYHYACRMLPTSTDHSRFSCVAEMYASIFDVDGSTGMQHARVYTLGKRGQTAHFKVAKSSLEEEGVDIHNTGRGGETTFHGPGQIVLYPVVNLRRLGLGARAYVEALEDCMVDACIEHGIHARVRFNLKHTGAWPRRLHKLTCVCNNGSGTCPWQNRCLGG